MDKKRCKLITHINNASMDYPFWLETGVCYCFSHDIILKFSKTAILEFFRFSDPNFGSFLVAFLSRKIVGWATQTKHFLDDRLTKEYNIALP